MNDAMTFLIMAVILMGGMGILTKSLPFSGGIYRWLVRVIFKDPLKKLGEHLKKKLRARRKQLWQKIRIGARATWVRLIT